MGKCVSNKMDTHFHLVILEFIGIGKCYYHFRLIWNIDGFGLKLKLADVNANTMDDVNPLFHVMADVIAKIGIVIAIIIW